MVMTRRRARSPVAAGGAALAVSEASTQTDPQTADAALQVSGCRQCLGPLREAWADSQLSCVRCAVVDQLRHQIKELQEEVSRLRSIREDEREIDRVFSEIVQLRESPAPTAAEVSEGSAPCVKVHHNAVEEGWKLVTSRRRRKALAPPQDLPLKNKFSALQAEEELGMAPREATGLADPVPCRNPRKKRRVIVVGDSLLQGTEAPICRPDLLSREVCCLPGARIRDVMERLPRLVHASDYYPLLIFHVGANDMKGKLETIKRDFRALGMVVKGLGAQVVFSSILPVRGKDRRRSRRIFQVNSWLRRWCWQQGFGFYDHGTLFEDQQLMGRDGIHLTKRGTRVFANRLASLAT
ncbi:uncharacterized protein [Struthio camelus]|uniref:uncharacterized protein n=1 Tax=Struthio camelus TaxID=8801 RepID=UPI003603F9D7